MDFAKVEIFKESLQENSANIAKSILEKIETSSLIEISGNRAILLNENDSLRVLSKMTPLENERILWGMIARETYKVEQSFPFSSFVFLSEIANNSILEVSSSKLRSKDLKEIGISLLGKSLGLSIVESLIAAGPNAIVDVEEIDGQTFIKVDDCLEIRASVPGEFGEKIELRSVNFFTFDGIIEKVSEINRLLEDLSSKDEPSIILARGFGYEVVSTLLHNWRLKKLKVIPATILGDPLDNFLFIDLPEIIKGNRIFVDDIWNERAEMIDLIEIENNKITIFDPRKSIQANLVSKKIIEESSSNPEMREWAQMRARKMSSRKITIYLGREYGGLRGIVKDRIQSLIRFVLFSRKDGISLVKIQNKNIILPSQSLIEAKKAAKSFVNTMKTTKAIIQNDKQ
jgi:hypothetical protein